MGEDGLPGSPVSVSLVSSKASTLECQYCLSLDQYCSFVYTSTRVTIVWKHGNRFLFLNSLTVFFIEWETADA